MAERAVVGEAEGDEDHVEVGGCCERAEQHQRA
jgi:hypothetical protein